MPTTKSGRRRGCRRSRRDPKTVPAYVAVAPHRRPGTLFPPEAGKCRVCNGDVDMSITKRKRFWHDGRAGEPDCVGEWKFRTRPNIAKRVLARQDGARCAKCRDDGKKDGHRGFKWLHLDHKIPLADLPLENHDKFDRGNLQLLCERCHREKTAAEATARAALRRAERAAKKTLDAATLVAQSHEMLVAC